MQLIPRKGLPQWLSSKESTCHGGDPRDLDPWGQEDALEKGVEAHSSTLAWRTYRQRSLMGYSPQGCKTVRHD